MCDATEAEHSCVFAWTQNLFCVTKKLNGIKKRK